MFFKEINSNSLMIQVCTCKIIKDAQPLDNDNFKVKHPYYDTEIDKQVLQIDNKQMNN